MNTKSKLRRFAAIFFALILALNFVLNQNYLLNVYASEAENTQTQESTEKKEEKQEEKTEVKQEEKTEEKQEEKKEETQNTAAPEKKEETQEKKTEGSSDSKKEDTGEATEETDATTAEEEDSEEETTEETTEEEKKEFTVKAGTDKYGHIIVKANGNTYDTENGTINVTVEEDKNITVVFERNNIAVDIDEAKISGGTVTETIRTSAKVTKKVKVTSNVKLYGTFSKDSIDLKEGEDYKLEGEKKNDISFFTTETYDFNEYSLDGGTNWESISTNPSKTLEDGKYTIKMRHYVEGDPDNSYESNSKDITIDTTAPEFNFKGTETDWLGKDKDFTIPVKDELSDIESVTWKVAGGEEKTITGDKFVLASSDIKEGKNTYTFKAKDSKENETGEESYVIKKDTSVPEITAININNENWKEKSWYGEGAKISISAKNTSESEENSGIKVTYSVDGKSDDATDMGDGTYSFTLKEGKHLYSVQAVSGTNTESSVEEKEIWIDSTEPSGDVTAKVFLAEDEITDKLPENIDEGYSEALEYYITKQNGDYDKKVTIKLYAKDVVPDGLDDADVSGIKSIEVSLDDAETKRPALENAVKINGEKAYEFVISDLSVDAFEKLKVHSIIDNALNSASGTLTVKPEYGTAKIVDITPPAATTDFVLDGLTEKESDGAYYFGIKGADGNNVQWNMNGDEADKPKEHEGSLTAKFNIDETFSFTKDGIFAESPEGGAWDGKTYVMPALKESDDAQTITFGYKDKAGNPMEGESKYGAIQEGKFTSKDLVIDTTFPVIKDFTVELGDGRTIEKEKTDYTNKKDISFVVDETNIDQVDVAATKNGESLSIPCDGKNGSYTLNSDKLDDGTWTFTVTATDKAGNSSTYTYKNSVVIDTKAPELTVNYTWNGEGTVIGKDIYTKKASIDYAITDNNPIAVEKVEGIDNLQVLSYKFPANSSVDDIQGGSTEEVTIKADLAENGIIGKSTISYTDNAGNKMVVKGEKDVAEGSESEPPKFPKGSLEEDTYTSPNFIIDNKTPVLSISLNPSESVNQYNSRQYYNSKPEVIFAVEDDHFQTDTVWHKNSKDISYKAYTFEDDNLGGSWKAEWNNNKFTVTDIKEYNYSIEDYKVYDLAGNISNQESVYFTYDETAPEVKVQDFYKDSDCKTRADEYAYSDWQKFDKSAIYVKIVITDGVSGVLNANYDTLIKTTRTDKGRKKAEPAKWDEPKKEQSYTFKIDANTLVDLLRGKAFDFSKNQGNDDSPANSVAETEGYHNKYSSIKIVTSTKPSNNYKGLKYYNKSVNFTVKMNDSHSGLKNYKITVDGYPGNPKKNIEHSYSDNAEGNKTTTTKNVGETLAAGQGSYYSSGDSPTVVKADFKCNVGHSRSTKEKYVIDNVKPVIKVTWTPATGQNKKYYNVTRTAHITVTERNFYEQGVNWKIKNRNAGVHIGGWTHKGDTHTCNVDFTTDGDDFVLDFDITDIAQNKATCPAQEPFTIDKTAPKISITFDNNNAQNGNYFNKARVATLHVEEHNFQAADVKYELSATNDGAAIGSPTAGGWSMGSDHHTAAINYNKDGDFSLNFNYTDMAGNPANKLQTEKFVIDMTAPVVEIFDVEDHQAYPKEIAPGVRYSDTNLDEDSLTIRMVGNRAGLTNYETYTSGNIHNGKEIKWKDFERIQKVDDIYTFDVVLKDKAGNENKPAKVTFSVNRFGSNYIFGEATEELLSKEHPYTNKEIPIEVREINVNTLKEKSVSIQDGNNNIRNLEEKTDYTVTPGSDRYQWSEYTYVIDSKNFENEGRYSVTLASTDAANNKMSNITKKKEINFVIDKTKPTAVISGVDDYAYSEDSHDFTVMATDNYGLKEAKISVDGKDFGTYTEEDFAGDQGVTKTLEGRDNEQTVKVALVDWAGNKKTVSSRPVLVTSNWFVQYYHNKPLFFGSIGAVAAAGIGLIGYLTRGFGFAASMAAGSGFWWLIFGKKDDDDEEN